MLVLDHLAVSASTLEEGVSAVGAALGVPLQPGGEHAHMGTHNRLLSLGQGLYLEVIAVNPAAPSPGRPRWFDLDSFDGAPRLTNWVVRCENLGAELELSPPGTGEIHDLERGEYRWRMAIPDDGRLPFDGAFPALIEWRGTRHPASALPESGCALKRLVIGHPQADLLRAELSERLTGPPVEIESASKKSLRAEIETPLGLRILS